MISSSPGALLGTELIQLIPMTSAMMPSGEVIIKQGNSRATIEFEVKADLVQENETFSIQLQKLLIKLLRSIKMALLNLKFPMMTSALHRKHSLLKDTRP